MWIPLTLICLAALAGLHFGWRRKCESLRRELQLEMEDYRRQHQQHMLEVETRQQVVFNSMLEGLLLLDKHRKIHLANRAFKNFFGIKIE